MIRDPENEGSASEGTSNGSAEPNSPPADPVAMRISPVSRSSAIDDCFKGK